MRHVVTDMRMWMMGAACVAVLGLLTPGAMAEHSKRAGLSGGPTNERAAVLETPGRVVEPPEELASLFDPVPAMPAEEPEPKLAKKQRTRPPRVT